MQAALVFGRANGVWDEIKEAHRVCRHFDAVIGINGAGCDYSGKLDHWVSFHSELFPLWLGKRERNGYSLDGICYWTNVHQRKFNPAIAGLGVKQIHCVGGSSGMVAVRVAMFLGFERIVLAGIPLDDAAGHYDEQGPWNEAEQYRKTWEQEFDELKHNVRSMSGWTQKLLGAPTPEWLQQKVVA